MPQTTAAAKALRSAARRRVVNDRWRRQLREQLKKMRVLVAAGDKQAAEAAYAGVQKVLDRAARHNVIHPRTAARKKSRLRATITKLAG